MCNLIQNRFEKLRGFGLLKEVETFCLILFRKLKILKEIQFQVFIVFRVKVVIDVMLVKRNRMEEHQTACLTQISIQL